jgi:16S rRNA (guanine966-N2)-methyltransferase
MIALLCEAQGYAVASNSGKDARPRSRRRASHTAPQDAASSQRNSVRIVGGLWRSRRIRFVAAPETRPTPDRVRETLFNWLQRVVPDSRCLDLFAGSGALGLEALSRGAREVTFVESDRAVAQQLRDTLAELNATGGAVVNADAFAFLRGAARPYDVVFLDPPFARGWLPELCTLLEAHGWLAPHAWIYLESASREGLPPLPAGWSEWRHARAGEVGAHLVRRGVTEQA